MQEQYSNTAILVFIRTDYEEARRKWFSDRIGYKGNLNIIRLLNQRIVEVAKQTALPIFIVSGKDQFGNSFGERFTNAFHTIFDEGYDRVIAIGNDCLELTKKHLIEADKALAEHDLVLGPTQDGGAYLIGLSKAVFQKEQFQILPWQQANLLEALCELVPSDDALILLNKSIDVDSKIKFSQVLKQLPLGWLKAKLFQLLGAILKQPLYILHSFFLSIIYFEYYLRGPPHLR